MSSFHNFNLSICFHYLQIFSLLHFLLFSRLNQFPSSPKHVTSASFYHTPSLFCLHSLNYNIPLPFLRSSLFPSLLVNVPFRASTGQWRGARGRVAVVRWGGWSRGWARLVSQAPVLSRWLPSPPPATCHTGAGLTHSCKEGWTINSLKPRIVL